MSLTRTLVLNVVGMTPGLLPHAPNLQRLAAQGAMRPLATVTPAVTTTVQSTFVTGGLPRAIVATNPVHINGALRLPKARIPWRLAQKILARQHPSCNGSWTWS